MSGKNAKMVRSIVRKENLKNAKNMMDITIGTICDRPLLDRIKIAIRIIFKKLYNLK